LLDRHSVPPVERPLQQLRSGFAAAGQHHPHNVKVVVVCSFRSGRAQAKEHVAQLGVRQAGPDDRAVQSVGEVPDLAAPRLLRGRRLDGHGRLEDDVRPTIELDQRNRGGRRQQIGRNHWTQR
jgi:hypothetical protein